MDRSCNLITREFYILRLQHTYYTCITSCVHLREWETTFLSSTLKTATSCVVCINVAYPLFYYQRSRGFDPARGRRIKVSCRNESILRSCSICRRFTADLYNYERMIVVMSRFQYAVGNRRDGFKLLKFLCTWSRNNGIGGRWFPLLSAVRISIK